MTEIDRSPAVVSTAIAVGAGVASLLGSAVGSIGGAIPAAAGLAVLGLGVVRASRAAVTAGAGLLFAGVLFAGASGAGPEPLLVGTISAVVAWDVGENGIGIGAQLGRAADTRRAELVHAASSLVVGAITAGLGYGVYRGATGGQPLTALVFLLVGAVVLVSALGR
ncbi:hypothetical protein SAMN04487948_102470 [Halogranum amylolyticum]|uniref:Uncharacterized protein n=1 Tax=Halogranum amylolyticum TaxID=660520 RepID=A0A1H8PTC5_9EURY|nr:hypothetical protein [Halogranum amylolyticum]SEO44934.1 hypothetical protein SAMN04487948_102470 [Halogranum amylolyticum]